MSGQGTLTNHFFILEELTITFFIYTNLWYSMITVTHPLNTKQCKCIGEFFMCKIAW